MKRWISVAACFLTSATVLQAAKAQNLDQGWSQSQQTDWYETSQGSRLLPLSWILALEQPDSSEPFLADDFMEGQYRMPMRDMQHENYRGPRGFAIDRQDDSLFGDTRLRWRRWQSSREPWWGPTCGGCHTSEIEYDGTSFAVPGGQTLADFQSFIRGINKALHQTYENPTKFARFADRVLGPDNWLGTGNNTYNRNLLRNAIAKLRYESRNHLFQEQEFLDDLSFGPGRLDAIGHIYDKIARLGAAPDFSVYASDSPTNFPFLWNVPQLDRVQWTGFAPNSKIMGVDIGALIRNVGEVSGVFADTSIQAGGVGYVSSVQITNLMRIEEDLAELKPPAWPNVLFGAPDDSAVSVGSALFADNCASCHTPMNRSDLSTPIETTLTRLFPNDGTPPLGTDPWTACNGYQATSATGKFFSMPTVPGFTVAGLGLMGPTAHLLDMTGWLQIDTIIHNAPITAASAAEAFILGSWTNGQFFPVNTFMGLALGLQNPQPFITPASEDKPTRLAECEQIDHALIAYKARPLNGIWASAPYLHNGSVPTLYDLLLPPEQRPVTFHTGTREFDPIKVGYVTSPAAPGNHFELDTRLDGNSNGGHVYAVGQLTHEQRQALVEYMKTL